jgi:hypothetical protein
VRAPGALGAGIVLRVRALEVESTLASSGASPGPAGRVGVIEFDAVIDIGVELDVIVELWPAAGTLAGGVVLIQVVLIH